MSPAGRFAAADIPHMLDALPVGILAATREGVVLHMNRSLSALTGFDPEVARGLPCRHVLRGRPCVSGCELGCGAFTASGAHAESERCRNTGGCETDILSLKGRRIPVRLTHFSVPDADGNELFHLDVVEDLTELRILEQRLRQSSGHGKLVGRSAAMERISALIPSVAPSSAPVLITGETGTGKDMLAEVLHQTSHRSREPFIRLNMSPLPEDLLAAEIFGQYSPSGSKLPGRFQQASGGTLYIPEMADVPESIQIRLVQYLDTGGVLPVGALRESRPDVRLISATNRDPEELVNRGLLREELLHRLNVVRISLPPLRERKEDIDFLRQHFLDMYAARFKKQFSGFSAEARALLADYDYPGNVRELKNIVEYAAMVCSEGEIEPGDLPSFVLQQAAARKSGEAPASGGHASKRSGAKTPAAAARAQRSVLNATRGE